MQNMHLRENMQIYANLGIMHIFQALIIIIIIIIVIIIIISIPLKTKIIQNYFQEFVKSRKRGL